MVRPTIRRVALLLAVASLACAPVRAQLMLPGAAPAPSADDDAGAAKPKKAAPKAAKAAKSAKAGKSGSGVASIAGRPLMLNGNAGVLQISGEGDQLQVDKLSLAGEGVSDSSQRCLVNIVGEKPIVATSAGRPDGLDRYEVEVPACPFAFDIVDGAAVVPPQITACVFRAADCQTSPSGVWGPDGASLASDADAIGKRRNDAETAMSKALRALEDKAKDNPDVADLVRDQGVFPGEREDLCREYAKEETHGFCAASVTEARAALLQARLAALAPAAAEASAKADKPRRRKPKPADAAKPVDDDAGPANPQ